MMLTVLTPVRQLYTDDEEVQFPLERIEDIIGRSDLADARLL